MSLAGALGRVYAMLSPSGKRQVVFLLILMVFNAFSEVGGVAGLLPFIAVASDPSLIQKQKQLHWFYGLCGSPNPHEFLIYLGVGFMVALVAMNLLNAATFWYSLRFSFEFGYRLSERVLGAYLSRPYLWFLGRNTSDLSKVVLAEVDGLSETIVLSAAELLTMFMVSVVLVLGLLFVDPVVAFSTSISLGLLYSLIYRSSRHHLNVIGDKRMQLNTDRHRAVHDALNAMKEARLFPRSRQFNRSFAARAEQFSHYRVMERLVAELPKYGTETLALTAIGFVLIYLVWRGEESQHVVPIAGLYAMATWRLVPALQTVYRNTVRIRFHGPVLELIERELEGGEWAPETKVSVPLVEGLRADNITFTYPGSRESALDSVSVDIPKGKIVAFVGRTGSGKSTLADVLAGLLPVDSGQVLIDGRPLGDDRRLAWQRNVGYVPQEIFLTDDTVANNVALGYPPDAIDAASVYRASSTARLADFVEGELGKGYDTPLGERGVALSGGQRQRIGIARALYDNPDLLILDEATSALDNLTEREVMEAIQELASDHGGKTLILIAHRLTTVQLCDRIYMLEAGRLIAEGTYQELLASSPEFSRLVNTDLETPKASA